MVLIYRKNKKDVYPHMPNKLHYVYYYYYLTTIIIIMIMIIIIIIMIIIIIIIVGYNNYCVALWLCDIVPMRHCGIPNYSAKRVPRFERAHCDNAALPQCDAKIRIITNNNDDHDNNYNNDDTDNGRKIMIIIMISMGHYVVLFGM